MKLTCHCTNIQITVAVPEELNSCNCSLCSRYQSLWGYYRPTDVEIETGNAGKSIYAWSDHEIQFVRCANCGCATHYRTMPSDPDPIIGVNFRMAPEEDLTEIPVRYSNGRSL